MPTPLTPNQIRGFFAAWGGWALDGMDSFIYSLVLAPALIELLPRSGIAASPSNVGYYGSVLFALFLIGWGMSMIWGPVADRFGRVRTLVLTHFSQRYSDPAQFEREAREVFTGELYVAEDLMRVPVPRRAAG